MKDAQRDEFGDLGIHASMHGMVVDEDGVLRKYQDG